MGSRMRFPGLNEYISKLNKLSNESLIILKKATAEGAKPIADQVKANLNALESISNEHAMGDRRAHRLTKITHEQKEGLIESFGCAPIRTDKDFINTKIGFDGYNKVVTRAHPKGQPNAMIARSLEKGTSYMAAQPFIAPATRGATRKKAEKAMEDYLNKEIDKLMK